MKITKIFASIVITLCLITFLTTTGVNASWFYYANSQQYSSNSTFHLNEFGYTPQEILPGGDHTEILGENHLALTDLILNENDKGYGLNINNNVLIHQYLKNNKVIYSNQKTSGGNLKFILDPTNNTHGLYYCIEKISDTEYHSYTFSVEELVSAQGTQREITAYKTILIKTNKWNATQSYKGYAKTIYLRNLGISATSQSEPSTIDVTTWHN